MNHIYVTMKRLSLYIIGMFILSLGVGLSIEANFGVSPVSSLAYAFSLTTGFSVGTMTIAANILFIILQIFISKRFILKEAIKQFVMTFVFGIFVDFSLILIQWVPLPESFVTRIILLIVSLFVAAIGLFGYLNARYPLMPYDELTYVISERFRITFSRAKITSDLLNVAVAGIICITFIRSLGSIGIGTVIAAYFIGKILGFISTRWKQPINEWLYRENKKLSYKKVKNLLNLSRINKPTKGLVNKTDKTI